MMYATHTLKQLSDLVFEIVEEREAKFLLIVSDDESMDKDLSASLEQRLWDENKKVVFIPAAKAIGNLLKEFYLHSRTETPDAIFLWELQRLTMAMTEFVLKELNFHRDALAALKVPIIVWLTNDLLRKFPSLAPDFWSRRTGIYRFTPQPTKELLERLFVNEKEGPLPPQSEIAKAIHEITTSERGLSKCIRGAAFKVEQADALIGRIQENVTALYNECSSGKTIDVALHLWSVTRLDETIEQMLDNVGSSDSSIYLERLYSGRNEVLLFATQQLSKIFKRYLHNIPLRVREKHRPDLVNDFCRIALGKLAEIVAEMQTFLGISISQLDHILYVDEFRHDSDKEQPSSTVDSAFSAQASYELESWLAGHSDKRPKIFSKAEGELLKLLYSNKPPISDVAQAAGMSITGARKEIRRLEDKVRLFLSYPEVPKRPPNEAKSTN